MRNRTRPTFQQFSEPLTTCAVETGSGKEGVSWKNVENDGEGTISAWVVGTFLL